MESHHNIRLTSAEIASLWTTYMGDTMSRCVLSYLLNKVEDTEIKPVAEYALSITNKHIQTVTEIFNHENVPIPMGFTEKDVNVNAPRLFDDMFIIAYLRYMGRLGVASHSFAYPLTTRSDVHDFFKECITSAAELEDQARKVMLSKGLYVRPPYISTPEKVDFIKKQSFLTGWFGERRPLTAIEITHLYSNLQTNILGKSLIMGFSQVAKDDEVRDYFLRGRDISAKHYEIFSSVLSEEHIPVPTTWDHTVMDSTQAPFSDKLMMFHISGLNATGITNYGAAIASSPRRDLAPHYTRLSTEILKYAEDGFNIMIDHGWMEQPPQADDRDELARR
ncbi:DUF3231 family protein [Ammoniphilus sp. YIM 78166]|uniref:DUF3231 family protein n=1 Tax=Ammoniphilus sp. YIM 78166 TaxID=1644106 RepID=UPI00106F768A|nr:DUF3231 family protein [Ammoniphilus sp. YIM 78166]